MFGQPKIHKEGYPLREVVDSYGSPSKEINAHIAMIIKPLVGNNEHYVKNSEHFKETIKDLVVEEGEILVSYDVKALYPSVPQDEAIEIIYEKLKEDQTLHKRTSMSAESITQLLRLCVKYTYFMFDNEISQLIYGLAIGASTSGFAADIFMERLEERALNSFSNPPKLWLRFVDDTFAKLTEIFVNLFLEHLNKQHPRIEFTSENMKDNSIAFLDTLVTVKEDKHVDITIYRKPTHTDQYLSFQSNHHINQKIGIVLTFENRINSIVTSEENKIKEHEYTKRALKKYGYPKWCFKKKDKKKNKTTMKITQ